MKQKIKIMKSTPEVSDQEIRSYMDFDGLLAKQKQQAVRPLRNIGWWGVLIIALGGISLWWFSPEKVMESPDSPVTTEKIVEDTSHADQPVAENNNTPESPEEKEADHRVEKNNAQSSATPEIREEMKPEASVPSKQESVYVQAEPVEGYAHLYQYFSAELVYPSVAIKDSVQGVLTVAFTVNVEGKPENIHVTQSLGEVFDQEAIRLIQNMPAWKPATLNNRPVPSKIVLPLTFQIQKIKAQD